MLRLRPSERYESTIVAQIMALAPALGAVHVSNVFWGCVTLGIPLSDRLLNALMDRVDSQLQDSDGSPQDITTTAARRGYVGPSVSVWRGPDVKTTRRVGQRMCHHSVLAILRRRRLGGNAHGTPRYSRLCHAPTITGTACRLLRHSCGA